MKLSLDESKGDPLIEETSTCGRRGSPRLAKKHQRSASICRASHSTNSRNNASRST